MRPGDFECAGHGGLAYAALLPRLYGNVALLVSGMILLSSRFTWKRKVAQAEGSAVQAGLEPAIAGQLASKEQL